MSRIIKIIQKISVALLFVLGIVVAATGVYCYHYQDQIIQKFLGEANKRLSNTIQMSSIQLTVFKSFPNIALILHDVVVKDRIDTATDVIAARKIYCVFDIWKLTQGQYVLDHFYLEHGKIYLGEDVSSRLGWKTGVHKTTQREVPLVVKLQKINLKEMEIVYSSRQQDYIVHAAQMQASIRWDCGELEAELQGKATIQHMRIADVSFAQNLPISLKAALRYNQSQKTWTLQPTQLSHERALLTIQGSWSLEAGSSIALIIQGKRVSPQLLLRCLPQQYYQQIKPYDLHGELTLNLGIRTQPCNILALQGDFVLSDGVLTTSQFSKPIELCQLSGRLSIPHVQNLKTATLSIDRIAGTLASSKLEGSFALHDFHNIRLQCAAKATFDLTSLSTLFAHPAITDASGELGLQWKLEANLQQLMRGAPAKDNLFLSGALQAQAAQFKLGQSQLSCKNLTGNLVFQDNALVMQDFSGRVGSGNFALDGTVQNLLPHLLSDNQKLCVDAKLYVDYLDLDALLYNKREFSWQTNRSATAFNIAPHWIMNLDCDIQQLHFRRFQGKNVRGKVKIKEQKLIAEKVQLGVAGGKIVLDGVLDASANHLNIHTSAKLQDVQIANFFYVFENFHQRFLTDSHLSGEVFSDVDLTIQADKQWKMCWDTLQAAIDFRMINGGLHDFEPLRKLSKYVPKESLTNLRFSALKNHISIKDQKIHLPPMEVHSNLTRIQLSGTHTFDGKVAYNFGVPFMGFQQEEVRGTPEVVVADTPAGINLFFKLQGDVNNYKISYDAEASKESLKGALKEQGNTIGALLKGKYKAKKQLKELTPDDYFEFDE